MILIRWVTIESLMLNLQRTNKMSHEIGTLKWMENHHGLVSPQESRAMMMKIIYLQLTLIPEEWLYRLGLKKPKDLGIDFATLAPPDSSSATPGCARRCVTRDL